MRALKIISTIVLAIVALTAGFVVTAVVAVALLAAFVASKLLGRPLFRFSLRPVRRSSPSRPQAQDAIEVAATEVEETRTATKSLPAAENDRPFTA